jgi:hypothetical protein
MQTPEVISRATKLLRDRIKAGEVKCDCGGPQYGTGHSPDCQIERAWDDAVADVRSDEKEAEEA